MAYNMIGTGIAAGVFTFLSYPCMLYSWGFPIWGSPWGPFTLGTLPLAIDKTVQKA